MRRPSHFERLDSSDRRTIRRIFLQIVSVYMSLVLIASGGVAAKSMVAARPDNGLSRNANIP